MSRSASGFTLLEIMLAVSILGIVILITYGVFTRTLTAKEYTESRAADTAAARSVLNRMARDLQNVTIRGSSPLPQRTPTRSSADRLLPKAVQQILFVSRNRTEAGIPFDDLAFSAMIRRPTGTALSATDLAVIRYFVESDPANPSRRALFRETIFSLSGQIFDAEAPDPANTVQILDGIAGLEFRFFDGRDWVQEWDSADGRNFGPAPHAIDVSLAIFNGEGEAEVFRTAIDLPVVRGTVPGLAAPGGTATPPSGEPQ